MYWFYKRNLCIFFLSVVNFWVCQNVSIFYASIFYDRKVNIVGTFERPKLKNPSSFQNHKVKKKKIQKNENIDKIDLNVLV